MAKKKGAKKITKRKISIGTLAGFAGVFLLFASMLNQSLALILVIILLLGFSAYKSLFK